MQPEKLTITKLKNYTPPDFLMPEANLQFMLDAQETLVSARLHIKRNPQVKKRNSHLKLDGVNLELQKITLNQNPLHHKSYRITSSTLIIFNVPDDFILETVVKIYPSKNLTCTGLYLTGKNFCTQNESHGFSTITYFIDRPDILTKFTTNIIARKKDYPVLLSNGNLLLQKQLATGYHQALWQDPFPKSPYLFALVAGKFTYLEDHYITRTTKPKRRITLRIFTTPHKINQCHHAMRALKQAMAWDEKTFGLAYDLDLYQIVAINDLNFGAMENKGLNVFNSKLLLATPATATDDDFTNVSAVIAHEYFHNWTGNRVTCRNWFQLGLKEGLTTLREQLFMEDHYGAVRQRLNDTQIIYQRQFPEDAGPLAHSIRLQSYIEVDNFYTATVYEKGAEVARMLMTIFGRKTFCRIMRKFLTYYDGQAVTIDDFIKIAAQVTKANLTQFTLWYDQCGTPTLNISDHFYKNKYYLNVKQLHPKAAKDLCIPLVCGLVQNTGKNSPTTTLLITKKTQTFIFNNIPTRPIPSLLRNFSAPVKIDYPYTQEELLFLAKYDTDPINRWEAGQKLMINIIRDLYFGSLNKQSLTLEPALYTLFVNILRTKKTDRALVAQMLKLPTPNQMLDVLSQCDTNNLQRVYEFIYQKLAQTLAKDFLHCYNINHENKAYTLQTTDIGKRALKNVCLSYLMYLENTQVYALARKQLATATNLTDVGAALVALVNSRYKDSTKLLARYYQKWQKQPNLVNKWLTINATIKHPHNLQRVQKLLAHPGFNIKNPNNVYALLRAFCERNLVNFHAASGSGYKFIMQQIIKIDKFNPQLAAFLTVSLTSGHKLEPKRQKILQNILHKLKANPRISTKVYEIVMKVLNSKIN